VGQGALAVECRAGDGPTASLLRAVEDPGAATAVAAERGFLLGIGGDCNTPLAAHATVMDGIVVLRALVIDHDGRRRLEDTARAPVEEAEPLGRSLAARLLAAGARELLAS
jgi:hydroxymethylbilane synthase